MPKASRIGLHVTHDRKQDECCAKDNPDPTVFVSYVGKLKQCVQVR